MRAWRRWQGAGLRARPAEMRWGCKPLGIGGSTGAGQRLQNPAPGGAQSGTEGGGHQVQEGERGWQINIFRPALAVGWGLLKHLIRCVCQADVTAS